MHQAAVFGRVALIAALGLITKARATPTPLAAVSGRLSAAGSAALVALGAGARSLATGRSALASF